MLFLLVLGFVMCRVRHGVVIMLGSVARCRLLVVLRFRKYPSFLTSVVSPPFPPISSRFATLGSASRRCRSCAPRELHRREPGLLHHLRRRHHTASLSRPFPQRGRRRRRAGRAGERERERRTTIDRQRRRRRKRRRWRRRRRPPLRAPATRVPPKGEPGRKRWGHLLVKQRRRRIWCRRGRRRRGGRRWCWW